MKTVKPSDLVPYDSIPENDKVNEATEHRDRYGWYFDEDSSMWFHHRMPTISEMDNNEFK